MTHKLTHNSQYGEVRGPGGVVITLTQDAYPDGTNEQPCYRAHGKDADDNDFLIQWETTGEWDEQQALYRAGHLDETAPLIEEDGACDWDDYTVKAC